MRARVFGLRNALLIAQCTGDRAGIQRLAHGVGFDGRVQPRVECCGSGCIAGGICGPEFVVALLPTEVVGSVAGGSRSIGSVARRGHTRSLRCPCETARCGATLCGTARCTVVLLWSRPRRSRALRSRPLRSGGRRWWEQRVAAGAAFAELHSRVAQSIGRGRQEQAVEQQ